MSWIKQVKIKLKIPKFLLLLFLKYLQVSRFVLYGLHVMKDTLEDLDIFSFSDNVNCQYLKKKKTWHSPKD